MIKKRLFLTATFVCYMLCFGFAKVKPNPWSLIIYRPENFGQMNDVRCWLKLEAADTNEDVTYTKAKAKYEWVSNTIVFQKSGDPRTLPRIFTPGKNSVLYPYQRTYFLSGGMAMHLNLQPGKYKISVYTPKDKLENYEPKTKSDWLSNEFFYDTENPTNVIFVSPVVNDNGFYTGGWHIDYKAPEFYKFTKGYPEETSD